MGTAVYYIYVKADQLLKKLKIKRPFTIESMQEKNHDFEAPICSQVKPDQKDFELAFTLVALLSRGGKRPSEYGLPYPVSGFLDP